MVHHESVLCCVTCNGLLMVHPTKRPCVLIEFWPVLSPNRTTSEIAGEIVFFFQIYPLVMTNIAIEHCHRNSEFSHWKWWIFPWFFVCLPDLVFSFAELRWKIHPSMVNSADSRTGCATVPPEPFARPCRCLVAGEDHPTERWARTGYYFHPREQRSVNIHDIYFFSSS